MADARLCKDCRYYVAGFDAMSDACAHPDLQRKPDLVRGDDRHAYCLIQRDGGKCGPEGKLWEAA